MSGNNWVDQLRIAEGSGGVMLSEVDCAVLRRYIEALLKKVQENAVPKTS